MQFKVKEGKRKTTSTSYKVILKTRSMDFYEGDVLKLQNPQDHNKICGAIVEKIQRGDEKILMDEYLRGNVGIELGEVVDVEIEHPENAEVVELIPLKYSLLEKDLIDDIKVRLKMRPIPIHSGNVVPIPIPRLYQTIKVLINKTEPKGIVIVTGSTELRFPIMNDEHWEAIEDFLNFIRNVKI